MGVWLNVSHQRFCLCSSNPGTFCISLWHLQTPHLDQRKTLSKFFPLNTFKEQKSGVHFCSVFVGSQNFIFPPSGSLICLNMKVYKLILKYGILRMFQSKVKLVCRTLLGKAEITVWLRGLKCSCLQLLSTSWPCFLLGRTIQERPLSQK